MFRKTIITLAFLLIFVSNASANILRNVSESACRVIAGNQCGSGTAVYEDNENIYVLTNAHVVSSYPQATVEFWKYGKKTNPIVGNIVWKRNSIQSGVDFAIIQVSKSRFTSLPRIIYFLPTEHAIKETGTYILTAGCPRSQWLSIKEGYVVQIDSRDLKFRPVAEDGQSGSGLFTVVSGKVYIAGVVTARTGRGEMLRNQQGFDITLGVALHINNIRLVLRNNVNHTVVSNIFLTNSNLYARDSSGRYWLQNSDGSVNVPPGTKITQWGYSGPTYPHTTQPPMVLPPGSQLQPLPGPVLPDIQSQPQTQPNDGYGTIPPGFGDPPPNIPEEVLPPDEEIVPEQTPETPETELETPKITELQIKIEELLNIKIELESNLQDRQTEVDELQKQINALQIQIEELKKSNEDATQELTQKHRQILELEAQLLELQKTIEKLNKEIELKNRKIEEYKKTINEFFVTITPPDDDSELETEPKKSIWSRAWGVVSNNPWWMLLLGAGSTLLLAKTSLLPSLLNGIKRLFTVGSNVHTVVQNNPEINDKLRSLLNEYFSKTESKLDATNDYVSSRFNEIDSKMSSFSNQDRNENVVNTTINVEKDDDRNDNCQHGGGLFGDVDYSKCKPNNLDRIKQFFELKKRDGESIEQWAFYALLYKEAMQLLRQGKFAIDVVGNKITLQGQRIAADKIDAWVRDQYIKRTSIEKLSLDYIYHEAMLGFLYKEAIGLLRRGHFPILGASETADVVENWVKREFLIRMGITL